MSFYDTLHKKNIVAKTKDHDTDICFFDLINLLNNSSKRFDGIDGNFYFKNNMIERNLDILKISNGNSFVIN